MSIYNVYLYKMHINQLINWIQLLNHVNCVHTTNAYSIFKIEFHYPHKINHIWENSIGKWNRNDLSKLKYIENSMLSNKTSVDNHFVLWDVKHSLIIFYCVTIDMQTPKKTMKGGIIIFGIFFYFEGNDIKFHFMVRSFDTMLMS